MLRRFKLPVFRIPWLLALPAVPAAVALVLATAGNEYVEDWRVCLTLAVAGVLLMLWRLSRETGSHQRHHRRLDPQHHFMAALTRFTFTGEGQDVPPALADEREQQPEVVPFRRPGAVPRHRAQARRRNA